MIAYFCLYCQRILITIYFYFCMQFDHNMSHTSRRGPPIECPLASLGRNTPSMEPPQTYHHPLSSSPLNPQVYQMSRKSPILNIDSDDIIYTRSHQQDATNNNGTTGEQQRYRHSCNTNAQPYSHRVDTEQQSSYRPPPARNYTPIDAILAYHDRLSPVEERSTSYHGTNEHNGGSGSAGSSTTGHPRNSNNVVIVNHHNQHPYYLDEKMSSMYIHAASIRHHPNNTERYYLEDNMDNLCSYPPPSSRIVDSRSSPNFMRRASSPSETSGSDRYMVDGGHRGSPAILSSSRGSYVASHHRSQPSTSTSLADGMSRFGRFSPSLDQGYATLVSPSPSGLQTPGPWNKKGPCRSGPGFDRLPDEAVLKIFEWLDSCDLCNITRVCRRFESLVWKPVLWRCIKLKGKTNCIAQTFDP